MEAFYTVRVRLEKKLILESIWRRTRIFVLVAECLFVAALGFLTYYAVFAYLHQIAVTPIQFVPPFSLLLYLIFWTVYRNYAIANRQVKHMQATYGHPYLDLEYHFYDDHFEEQNLESGGITKLKYGHLRCILRCKNMFLLRYSQAAVYLPYEGVSSGGAEELEAFLKSKMVKK